MASASTLQVIGAGGFGVFMGWQAYFVNRYRSGDVRLADLAELAGVLGGGAILAVFPSATDLFGAYGIGLCLGFAAYLATLLILVSRSENFDRDWFLDGRRCRLREDQIIDGARQTSTAMEAQESRPTAGTRQHTLERE